MKNSAQNKNLRAFTLIEVLVAISIFSLVVTSLYTTFRVGMRAYASGEREINRMQHVRVIFDTIDRDIRSIYYLPETSYNLNLRRAVSRFQQEWMKAELEGRLDEFLYGDKKNPGKEEARNPYEMGIEINLQFKADHRENLDSMSFVRYQYNDGLTNIQPWGLGRIRYVVEGGQLIRSEEDIIEPMKDMQGIAIEEKIPRRDVLAEGVKRFELRYGFFYQDDWMEAEDWDSKAKRYRNPTVELDEEDPDYQVKMKREQMKPEDGLPAFIRIALDIEDEKQTKGVQKTGAGKKAKSKIQTFSTLIRVPTAQENYLPSLEEENEEKKTSSQKKK
jgi:prepilin-type N-terminal cleavage/methylation domain-containing protein